MNFTLAEPWALCGLLALPLLWWLHRHVVEARRLQVSSLWLWQDGEPTKHEGRSLRRVPERLVLLLELLAALALVLLCAGLDVKTAGRARPKLLLLLDGSASMSGAQPGSADERPLQRARRELERLAREHPDLAVTLVIAAEQASLLGERDLSADEALRRLDAFVPHGSVCRMEPALELADALGVPSASMLIVSDDPELQHPRLLRVGRPLDNNAIVEASWVLGAQPFVVVHRFGAQGAKVSLDVEIDQGRARSTQRLELPPNGERALQLPVDAQTRRVELRLSDDALALDNRVSLLRPLERRVSVGMAGLSPALEQATRRAVRAIPRLRPSEQSAAPDLLIAENPAQPGAGAMLAFLTRPSGVGMAALELEADPFAPLMVGVELRDAIWYAFDAAPPAGAQVLLRSGERALIYRQGAAVYINVKLERSNLLEHSTFPILLSNLADELDAAHGGLPDANLRQGTRLKFARAAGMAGDVMVRAPSGKLTQVAAGSQIDVGVLDEAGVYSTRAGAQEQSFAVALLAPHESDLTRRVQQQSAAPVLRVEQRLGNEAGSRLRVPLWLVMIASLALAYALLAGLPLRRLARRT